MTARSLADQIRAQAAISARPGQLQALETIADQVAELEHARDGLIRMLRAATVEAVQRRPLGMRDIADTLAFLAMQVVQGNGLTVTACPALRREFTDRFEDLLNRLPEGTIGGIREAT
ncbi:hypothetical protein [Nocardia niwae]|uniref:hypothetical protein n=1 Tax=Nocardia niwae TaxID=626084 RepID=UPI0007A4DA2A|nr:hypothetical protein [Nocardia niwae]